MYMVYKEILPDPARVIEGLRDTGYQFETAVEDILDNSISADATLIDVNAIMDYEGNIELYIADNGYGMNAAELENAMRYGSQIRKDSASLGIFGLGLKTASTAFCRSLSVVSRDASTTDFSKATWDIDHVVEIEKWEVNFSKPTADEIEYINKVSDNGVGTLVIWRKVDRLIKDYSRAGGIHAKNALNNKIEILKRHSSMVYQRFLDSEDSRARNLNIRINGENLKPWDPFCCSESEMVAGDKVEVEIETDSVAEFTIKAYVLPRKEDFSSLEAAKKAYISNEMQGIYVYRENRLIYGPDWFKLYSKEPHTTLLRIEFSFDHKMDEAFHIDIKKSQIILNEELINWLKKFINVPRRAADQAYRQGLRKQSTDASKGIHDSSNKTISEKEKQVSGVQVTNVDPEKNEAEIENKHGFRLKIKTSIPKRPGEVFIQPVEGIDDNLLWEPVIIEEHTAVKINIGHDYYSKVYIPNKRSGVTIQGLDSLLWALCEAELEVSNDQTHKFIKEMRFAVSRILRTLVEDLPDPEVDED